MILKRKYCILPFILKAKFNVHYADSHKTGSFHWSYSNTLQKLSACFLQLGSKINSFTFLQHGALSDFEYDYQETIRPPSVFFTASGSECLVKPRLMHSDSHRRFVKIGEFRLLSSPVYFNKHTLWQLRFPQHLRWGTAEAETSN